VPTSVEVVSSTDDEVGLHAIGNICHHGGSFPLVAVAPAPPISYLQDLKKDRHLAVISAAVEHIEDNQAVSDASGQAM